MFCDEWLPRGDQCPEDVDASTCEGDDESLAEWHQRPARTSQDLTKDDDDAHAERETARAGRKAVLITGASTGIGAALARAFAGQGARVGLHFYASVDAAEALAGEIREAGGTVELVRANAADPEELRAAVDTIAEKLGGLDGLINNAGGMVKRVTYEDATDEDYVG